MKSKAIQRWMARGGKVRGYAMGGEIPNLSGPGTAGYTPDLGLYSLIGEPKSPKDDDKKKKEESPIKSDGQTAPTENVGNVGSSPISNVSSVGYKPAMEKYNQGGFVDRLPYDYQDEPDFGASGVDTNYGEWDEEEDEQEQPAGITISFASALQKRKRK